MMPRLLLAIIIAHCFVIGLSELVQYELTVQQIPANPNGFPRSAIAVYPTGTKPWGPSFRPFPGPTIQAFLNDVVNVTVHNAMEVEVISIHFHGIHMKDNVWMDGVHMVTECGIAPGASFSYVWRVTQTGTFWYHSHAGVQYSDGLQGPIILKSRYEDKKSIQRVYKYQYDYVMMMQDWYHHTSTEWLVSGRGPTGAFPGFKANSPPLFQSLLLNGRGQYTCKPEDMEANFLYGSCSSPPQMDRYQCASDGGSIRLRLINSGSSSALRFWIDGHNLTIVARDGTDVVPEEVEFVAVTISMRVDVIVNCTNDPSFDYFIYAGFASGYLHSGNRLPAMAAQALLTYSNITRPISATDRAHLLDYKRQPDKQLDEYRLYKPSRSPTTPGADHRIFIHYAGVNIPGDGTDTGFWTVNENRFMMPMRAPLLQSAVLSSDMASAGLGPPMQPEYSSFTESTYIEHLEHGKRYEIVLWSRNGMFHPWHLHGHTVDVIRVGKLTTSDIPSYLNEFNQSRKDWRNFDFVSHIGGLQPMSEEANVLFRGDSFTVPDWGYVIFRFTADNIGPWMFHCHIEWFAIGGSIWHMAFGMGMVFSVESHPGAGNPYQLLGPPPDDFPTCGPVTAWHTASAGVHANYGIASNGWFWVSMVSFVIIGVLVGTIGRLTYQAKGDAEVLQYRSVKGM